MSTNANESRSRSARGGRGRQLRFTFLGCRVGRLLVVGTDAGVCAVALGTSDAALEAALRAQYFAATLKRDDAGLRSWARLVREVVDGSAPSEELPLDLHGTDFQRRVWAELKRMPRGEIRSYSELAAAVGSPRATRAVAKACASNPLAVLVPCHRAVRRDGGLGGYRWGAAIKKKLLGVERAQLDWSGKAP